MICRMMGGWIRLITNKFIYLLVCVNPYAWFRKKSLPNFNKGMNSMAVWEDDQI